MSVFSEDDRWELAGFLLAGPHSSVIPSFLQPPVMLLGWGILLVGPVLVARAVWRRLGGPK
jgi:hypothetical protein